MKAYVAGYSDACDPSCKGHGFICSHEGAM